MLIIILIIATALAAAWVWLLYMAAPEDWVIIAYNKVFNNLTAIEKLRERDRSNKKKLSGSRGIALIGMKFIYGGNPEKKIEKLSKINEQLQDGDLKKISILEAPGYVLQRKYDFIGKGGIHKKIMAECYELYGKKYAGYRAKNYLAKILSYPLIGLSATLAFGAILAGAGSAGSGNAIIGIGSALVLIFTYMNYDELNDRVKKRREAIKRQSPSVVSKLALLVTSGMIMDRAWKETAYSQGYELYQEMRRTSEELDNLVSPESAYGEFICRCNTKETARLASAILQNLSKGNAEIGRLLKDMAREAWQERRHTARRDAEKANSRLMIPTMLLFLAILIMLMVPVAMNFSGI